MVLPLEKAFLNFRVVVMVQRSSSGGSGGSCSDSNGNISCHVPSIHTPGMELGALLTYLI